MGVSKDEYVEVVLLRYSFYSSCSRKDSGIVDDPDFPVVNLHRVHFWQSFSNFTSIHVSGNRYHRCQSLEFINDSELGQVSSV